MSRRSSKLDLIVRVRYANPLPAPPCPPKLLTIPTTPARYARPEFTDALFEERQYPMAVDAECGMPLDLSAFPGLWGHDEEDPSLNPEFEPPVDPRDAFLFEPVVPGTTNGHGPAPAANVSWLRKTEYLSRENVNRISTSAQGEKPKAPPIDVSREKQIEMVDKSFLPPVDQRTLEALVHPTKRHLRAVEAFPVLPDASIWPNKYDVFKFAERPGERELEEADPRLDAALLRPMEADGEHFLSFYVTADDETAERFKRKRERFDEGDDDRDTLDFRFVRDYETQKIEQECTTDFLLVLDDEEGGRQKGAYYKTIERRIWLRKKRLRKGEVMAAGARWDLIHLTHVQPEDEEAEERREAQAEVDDPDHWIKVGDADAEGEMDVDAEGEVEVDGAGAAPTEVAIGMGAPGDVIVEVPADSQVAKEFVE